MAEKKNDNNSSGEATKAEDRKESVSDAVSRQKNLLEGFHSRGG